MPLENVTALSDDDEAGQVNQPGASEESAPIPAAASNAAAPKATPKSKPSAKPKAKGASKAKAKAKTKSGAKNLKRPAAALEPEEAVDGPVEEKNPTKMKRPASSTETILKVNKYIYHRDGVWGIKVNGKEIIRARVWGKGLGISFNPLNLKTSIFISHRLQSLR